MFARMRPALKSGQLALGPIDQKRLPQLVSDDASSPLTELCDEFYAQGREQGSFDSGIQRALARTGGQVSEAAKTLGLSRSALYRRLEHHGLKGQE